MRGCERGEWPTQDPRCDARCTVTAMPTQRQHRFAMALLTFASGPPSKHAHYPKRARSCELVVNGIGHPNLNDHF